MDCLYGSHFVSMVVLMDTKASLLEGWRAGGGQRKKRKNTKASTGH